MRMESRIPLLQDDEEASLNHISHIPTSKQPGNGTSVASSKNPTRNPEATDLTLVWKLVFGSLGIYAAFLYHGNLEEDLFLYKNDDSGEMFRYVWLLQVLESLSGFAVGMMGHLCSSSKMEWRYAAQFWLPGASQVFSKALTSQALAVGLSFPVVVLAKSAKIVPVMCGQLALGGARYGIRDYLFVLLVVGGTVMLTAGGEELQARSNLGIVYIVLALFMDGVTAGLQKRIQKPSVYDFLAFTNMAMVAIAFSASFLSGEWDAGVEFLRQNSRCVSILVQCCLCSAVGQSFVFFIIATFDPLVLSTITTTRKILSVLLSIFLKSHTLTHQGVTGLGMALAGLLVEVEGKLSKRKCAAKRLPGR